MDSSSATTLASPRMCTDLEMLAEGQDLFVCGIHSRVGNAVKSSFKNSPSEKSSPLRQFALKRLTPPWMQLFAGFEPPFFATPLRLEERQAVGMGCAIESIEINSKTRMDARNDASQCPLQEDH